MNSKAGHQPIRSCVTCRQKRFQSELISFLLLPEGMVFDLRRKLQARKHYVCPEQSCIDRLTKWRIKKVKGRQA